MLQNLKIEWLKIKNYKVFQVFSILYVLGILAIVLIFYYIYIKIVESMPVIGQMQKAEDKKDLFDLFGAENIWKSITYSTSFLLYLPGMIIISLFTNEVNFKTHRQNIIDGWKRETFIYSKITLIVCFSIIITLVNALAVIVMALITKNPISFEGSYMLVYSFFQAFTYLLFALTLATIFRKSGVAIILFFVYGLLLELLFAGLINSKLGLTPAGYFLPLQVADSLTPMPKGNNLFYPNMPEQYIMLIGTVVMCSVYIFFAVRKYKYDDL